MCFVLVHFAHHPSSIDSRWFARKPASQALVAYTCHSLRLAIALYRSSYCSGPVLVAFPRRVGFIWAFPRPSQPPVVNRRRSTPARHRAISHSDMRHYLSNIVSIPWLYRVDHGIVLVPVPYVPYRGTTPIYSSSTYLVQ